MINRTTKVSNSISKLLSVCMILCALFMAGCSIKPENVYKYDTDDIRHEDNVYVTQTKYYDDRVEVFFNTKISSDGEHFDIDADDDAETEVKGKKLVIYTDDPKAVTSLYIGSDWKEVFYRYLDTEKYACIWHYWADDLGWDDFKGDTGRYYTEEEKKQQAERAKRYEEERKKELEQDAVIAKIFTGRWLGEDGSYIEIFDRDRVHVFRKKYIEYEMPDESYVTFIKNDQGEGNYWMTYQADWSSMMLPLKMAEDEGSFEYEGVTYRRVDEDIWAGVDTIYVQGVQKLFDNAEIWQVAEDLTESESEEDTTADTGNNTIEELRYAVTDLEWDGYPEIIISGHTGPEEYGYSEIYELQEDGSVKKLNEGGLTKMSSQNVTAPPYLYAMDSMECFRYNDEYRYMVWGSCKTDTGSTFTQYYHMMVQYDIVTLEKMIAKDCLKDNDGEKNTYYNYHKGETEEISEKQYDTYMDSLYDEFNESMSLRWFDEVSLENMAGSISVFAANRSNEEE
ncbi:MAG: hypothetical protein K6G69_03755 [Lachnospiraceae bacterium]|nr:hypothetical protein [Lachnospiraceae bacterium]